MIILLHLLAFDTANEECVNDINLHCYSIVMGRCVTVNVLTPHDTDPQPV